MGYTKDMIYFSTSGFSYDDWVGYFYAIGMSKRECLTYYAREFNTCVVNSTFYALPKPSSLKAMTEKTGDNFLSYIKANQEMTHQWEDNAPIFEAFCQVLEPVITAGKLGCIIAQFPEATSKIGYIRFHGRNSAKWWQHEHAYERYDYGYTPQELSEWLPRIQKLNSITEKTFIFANNHWRGQAGSTIRQLRIMLD
jgi:uncharacterized protein YecE (DUF72 family)